LESIYRITYKEEQDKIYTSYIFLLNYSPSYFSFGYAFFILVLNNVRFNGLVIPTNSPIRKTKLLKLTKMLLMKFVVFFVWLCIVNAKVKLGLQNLTGRADDYRIKIFSGVSDLKVQTLEIPKFFLKGPYYRLVQLPCGEAHCRN